MVFFTCFHCGESIKKPSVSKHYLTKCRNNDPYLTCVDCLKDFRGAEYEAHTKCMTEDERYSAKGCLPKASQKKGERKQQAWQECIQTVLKKSTLRQDERDLIKAISKYENVPRKKSKFVNFLTNAFKHYSNRSDLIDRVWIEMESVFKESLGSSKEQEQDEQENAEKEESHTQEEETGKKEKKRKRKAEESKLGETSESEKTNEKEKKKKAKKSEENGVAAVVGNGEVSRSEEQREKKSKKRKACENGETEQNGSVADEAEPGKKKKKKKHEKVADNEINSRIAEENVGEQKSKKKKESKTENEKANSNVAETAPIEENNAKSVKKAKKSENKENCTGEVEKETKTEGKVENCSDKKNNENEEKQESFDWKATILQVLNQECKNNKIPLEKLQKKVLKLHCKILNCERSGKKEKKFLKKLKEMPQIEIEEDFVLLKS